MIISHQYRYLFVEMDHTGSTAISQELCEHYGGEKILWKHARYCDFMAQASPEEKKYFSFSGQRNPLDLLVTLYFRHQFNPDQDLSNIQAPDVTAYNYKLYSYIKKHQADFPTWFKQFFRGQIYYEWKARDFQHLDYIYQFENLPSVFETIIKRLGLSPNRPLPVRNKTAARQAEFEIYYSPDIQTWAQIILRDLMRDWGYQFPSKWPRPSLWLWIYYYLWLKPLFWLRQLYHLLIDRPQIYRLLYVNETGWSYRWRCWHKKWQAKLIDHWL